MAYFCLILTVVIWGLSYIVMKDATEQYPRELFQFWRYLVVTIVYAALFWKSVRHISARLWKYGLIKLGLANFVISFFSIFAVQYTTPTRVVVINSLIIGVVPLLQYLHYGTRITRQEKIAVGISLAAIALLIEPHKMAFQIGDGLALIGMVGYAYVIVFTNELLQRERTPVIHVSFLCIAGTAFYFAWVALFFAIFKPGWLMQHMIPTDASTIAGILYMILFVSIISNLLQTYGQQKLSPVIVSIVFCLEPFVTGVLDFLLFGNVPTLGVVLCGMLLITATVTASFKKREREPTVGA